MSFTRNLRQKKVTIYGISSNKNVNAMFFWCNNNHFLIERHAPRIDLTVTKAMLITKKILVRYWIPLPN